MPNTPNEKSQKQESTLELMATLYTLDQLKEASHNMPQIVLAGRSNVGKSSLINALAKRKNLAKVSSEPGKTRSINLFLVKPEGFCITDLPGYGYARRGHEERRYFAALIQKYLESTRSLCALVLLIDCRIPTQESDLAMANFARAKNLPVIAVLTKADKCTLKERSQQQKRWENILGGERPMAVSSVTRFGLEDLWAKLRKAAEQAKTTEPENNGS